MWLGEKTEPSSIDLLISGGLAGMACWVVGYPQDVRIINKRQLKLFYNVRQVQQIEDSNLNS